MWFFFGGGGEKKNYEVLSHYETFFFLCTAHWEYNNNGSRQEEVVCLVAKSCETRHPPNIVPLFLSSISMQVQALNLAPVKGHWMSPLQQQEPAFQDMV